jgi:hypothetical protein
MVEKELIIVFFKILPKATLYFFTSKTILIDFFILV